MMLRVLMLLLVIGTVSNAALPFEITVLPIVLQQDPDVMGRELLTTALTGASIPNMQVYTNMGHSGNLNANINNIRTTNINHGELASLANVDPESMILTAPGMTFDVTARWNARWRKYFFSIRDSGTIRYHVRADVMTVAYYVKLDEIPATFDLQSCEVDMEFSDPTITSRRGYSRIYRTIISQYEEALVVKISDKVCDLLDPGKNEAVAVVLQSFVG